jgi:DNA-directed RNA polymerase subunit RPC12/RpoP
MITFLCIYCGKRITALDKYSGTEASCPNCNASVRVPRESPAATETPKPKKRFYSSVLSVIGFVIAYAFVRELFSGGWHRQPQSGSNPKPPEIEIAAGAPDLLEAIQFDPKGNYYIRPPRGWVVLPESEGGLFGIATVHDGFAPNVTVRKGKFPATVSKLERLTRNEYSDTPRKRIESSTLVAVGGVRIGRVLTEKFKQSKGYDMRYTFYSIPGRHGENFLLTFMCPVSVADKYQDLADACVASFVEK